MRIRGLFVVMLIMGIAILSESQAPPPGYPTTTYWYTDAGCSGICASEPSITGPKYTYYRHVSRWSRTCWSPNHCETYWEGGATYCTCSGPHLDIPASGDGINYQLLQLPFNGDESCLPKISLLSSTSSTGYFWIEPL
jgi:hypothetical protein